MNRKRINLLTIALAALCLTFPQAAATSAADAAVNENTAEAKALREAETKLAALVKEAQRAQAATIPVTPAAERQREMKKQTAKKQTTKLRKKKSVAKRTGTGAGVAAGGDVAVRRRLTERDVQAILASTRDFSGADLSGVSLVGWDLSGVKLNRASLKLANLERVNLSESDLELADLTGANLTGALLNQARVRGARLEGTRLDGAIWTDKTICRKGSVGSCIE